MAGVWRNANIQELGFAAAASLLAIQARQMSIREEAQSGDEYDSEEEDVLEGEATAQVTDDINQPHRMALIDKFLTRFAELLARKKSDAQRIAREDAKHVAAAAWINGDHRSPLTILWAKNDGADLDPSDKEMADRLQIWLRAISLTGRVPSMWEDLMWIGEQGLLEYSRDRLQYYVSQVREQNHVMKTLSEQAGAVYGPVVARLRSLCQNFVVDRSLDRSTLDRLCIIVNEAYQLRCALQKLPTDPGHSRSLKLIAMLGRIQAVYECFKTTALTFPEFDAVVISPINLQHTVEIDAATFQKHLKNLRNKLPTFSKRHLKKKGAQDLARPVELHVHAEIQILASLETKAAWQQMAHRYIGTSRKPCFLCSTFNQNYIKISTGGPRSSAFTCRACHGKVYPRWTIPDLQTCLPNTNISMAAAIRNTYGRMLNLLRGQVSLQSAIAESSAGVTLLDPRDSCAELKQRNLASQRLPMASPKNGDKSYFGAKVKSVQVGVLPADGTVPRLVPITFFRLPKRPNSETPELGNQLMPDFSAYWRAYHVDRQYRAVEADNQPVKSMEGEYQIYWNVNDELPENKYIKALLDIRQIEFPRRFWYGDVFVVRFSEHPKTFAYDVYDASDEVLGWHVLRLFFEKDWQEGFLDAQQEQKRYYEEADHKREADKHLILQRMTVEEQKILQRLPPSTLDLLALTSCDDGALLQSSVEPGPIDRVKISILKQRSTLESMGWESFDSSQL